MHGPDRQVRREARTPLLLRPARPFRAHRRARARLLHGRRARRPQQRPEYVAAVEALYAVSYAAKFQSKRELDRDYVVGPLEGLWSADDPATFVTREKSAWSWTMMIWQPDWLTPELVAEAISKAGAKAPAASLVHFERLAEGRSVQTPPPWFLPDEEGPTLARLHDEFMPERGLRFNGRHHEVTSASLARGARSSSARA